MRQLRKSKWLLAVATAGVVVLALGGLGLLGAYFYLSRQGATQVGWISPLDAARSEAVAPDLAVLSLAGEPDDRVIRAALDAGEVETAFTGLAYSVLLPDSLRAGQWLLLSDRYQKAEPERAAAAAQAALDIAALSPAVGDMGRADVSLQVSARFSALKRLSPARLALAQAESIARYSPALLPAQRRSVLERVEASYRALKDEAPADAVRRDIETASLGPGVKLEPASPLLPSLRGGVTLSQEVTKAISVRQQAAANMAARWLSSAPSARNALVDALGSALLAEDAARAQFYVTSSDLSEVDRLAVLHDRVTWLTTKYRAARGAFGISLVPQWTDREAGIREELLKGYTDLINGYGRQLDTLLPAEASQARVELLRQGLLAIRLGLFPEPDTEKELSAQLVEASRDLWTRQGSVGLVNILQEDQEQRFYLLSGSDIRRQGLTPKP